MARDGAPAARHVDRLRFHAVGPDRWKDFEALFEARGGPKYCWCMAWRPVPTELRTAEPQARKQLMHDLVARGVPVGILAYLDETPVGWCSIAPRPTYRPLGGVEEPGERPESVWSLACLYVARAHRKHGLARLLVQAAIEHARSQGAAVVEAYPVDPDSPSYRFMGFVPMFQAMGFHEVGRAGSRRHVMRLRLEA